MEFTTDMLNRVRDKSGVNMSTDLLVPLIEEARDDIALFLNSEVDERFSSKLISLAVLRLKSDQLGNIGVKSTSYSEGSVSESKTLLTPEDYANLEQKLFDSIKQYRRVKVDRKQNSG